MSAAFDHLMIRVMRLAAARLDPNVDAETYVQMICDVVDKAVADDREDRDPKPIDLDGPPAEIVVVPLADRVPLSGVAQSTLGEPHAPDDNDLRPGDHHPHPETPAAPAAEQPGPAPSQEGAGSATGAAGTDAPAKPPRKPGRKSSLSPERRAELRRRIVEARADARAAGYRQLPNGTLTLLAEEFDVSWKACANIRDEISREEAPADPDRRRHPNAKLSDDQLEAVRERIRAARAQSRERGSKQLPRGTVPALAQEFRVSNETIYDVARTVSESEHGAVIAKLSTPPAPAPSAFDRAGTSAPSAVEGEPASDSAALPEPEPECTPLPAARDEPKPEPRKVNRLAIHNRIALARQDAATLGQKDLPRGAYKRIADELVVTELEVQEEALKVPTIEHYASARKSRQLRAAATAKRMDASVAADRRGGKR